MGDLQISVDYDGEEILLASNTNNPLDTLDVTTATTNKLGSLQSSATSIATESSTLVYKVGAVLIVIAIMIGALALIFSSGHTRDDAKQKIVWIVIGGVIFFAAVSAIGLFVSIGNGIFG